MKIIYQFLHDETLKPLLEEKNINLLENALRVKKPGMNLVCRLYWRQDRWQRLDSIMKILNEKEKDNHTLHEVLNSLAENNLLTMCNDSSMYPTFSQFNNNCHFVYFFCHIFFYF